MTVRFRRPILPSAGALELLPRIVSARQPLSRGWLVEITGLSRVTIGQRLGELFETSIIRESDSTLSTGGRPKRQIELNNEAGLIAAADVGETHLHVGITDLAARVLADKYRLGIAISALLRLRKRLAVLSR